MLLSYIALLIIGGVFLEYYPWLIIPFIIYVVVLSGALLFICWKKGEKPELRWGRKL